MLQELEEYVTPLMSSTKKSYRHSIESWRARLSLTQVRIIDTSVQLVFLHTGYVSLFS